MAKPVIADVYEVKLLSNISIRHRNNQMIADQVFPTVTVVQEDGKYFEYERDAFRIPNLLRADGAPAIELDWGVKKKSYSCDEFAAAKIVTDRIRRNQDAPLNMDVDTTEFLTDQILLDFEKRVRDVAFDPANYAAGHKKTLSATEQWSNYGAADSDPFKHIEAGIDAIEKDAGKKANLIVLGKESYRYLRHHPDILDRVKYTSRESVTLEILAELFDVERVLVGRAVYDTAPEGATPSLSYVWDDRCLVAFVDPKPGIKTMTLGITFRVQGFRKTKKFRVEVRGGDLIEVVDCYDAKMVSPDCGYLISDTVA